METFAPPALEILELPTSTPVLPTEPPHKSKQAIRTSLKASTLDGVLAVVFGATTTGVLLTNFLLQLGASPVEIGLLSSIPMVVNLLQPVGAYIADRTTSRHLYCLWIFGPSRLLWLILVLGIGWGSYKAVDPHHLVILTLGIIFATSILGALGSSAWFSWMAALVPHRLRGRYFGLRNSAASLTNLLIVPILGLAVAAWPGGTIQGYGVLLLLGIVAGIASLGFQSFMVDVNPQRPQDSGLFSLRRDRTKQLLLSQGEKEGPQEAEHELIPTQQNIPLTSDEHCAKAPLAPSILRDTNFLTFLLYFGLWTFAVNLSAPFFNLYLLDNLALDIGWATLYTSLASGANLLILMLWGKLADRLGNRPLLLLVGILVAVTPLLWLGVGTDSISLWVWLPLLHLLTGGTWAAIDLCSSNIQMEVAPGERSSTYFAIAAAVAGVSGALGTTAGGIFAALSSVGGLPGLFALSVIVRLVAMLPLLFVREPRSQPVVEVVRNFLGFKSQLTPLQQ